MSLYTDLREFERRSRLLLNSLTLLDGNERREIGERFVALLSQASIGLDELYNDLEKAKRTTPAKGDFAVDISQ
jgi:hypothetical protein